MNGYDEKHHYDDEPQGGFVRAFDAFPKSKPQYVTRTSGGGKWTVIITLISCALVWTELARWWRGEENHTFTVEKGIGREMQINLDIVMRMQCKDLHVNVQDAAGDRILASARLQQDPTQWKHWVDAKGVHQLGTDEHGRAVTGAGYDPWQNDEGFGEEHVHDIVAAGLKKARWHKTPRVRGYPDSCRIFGSLDLNKVQGDFHITARGHGYAEFGEHLEHDSFNFSHVINELSFGPFYPSLVNPLDRTVNIATAHFHKFQYFMSVVPTIYSTDQSASALSFLSSSPQSSSSPSSATSPTDAEVARARLAAGTGGGRTIFTNQYAVTEQSHEITEMSVPGLFFKYDIEPIMLTVEERRDGLLALLVKATNVLSGVLVAGHWTFALAAWAREVLGRRRSSRSEGVIGAKSEYDE